MERITVLSRRDEYGIKKKGKIFMFIVKCKCTSRLCVLVYGITTKRIISQRIASILYRYLRIDCSLPRVEDENIFSVPRQ